MNATYCNPKGMMPAAVLALALGQLVAPVSGGLKNGPIGDPPHGWSLVWSDEFETSGLPDESRWDWDVGGHGWGNRELQFYTDRRRENARVENGLLVIEALREGWKGMEYTSARLVTKGRKAWQEGRFEIRARLPDGRGTWPAIWMLPVDWDVGSGKWPDVGEIDIMEHVGHDPGIIHASAHSRDYQWQAGTQKTGTVKVADAARVFHTYTLEWDADEIRAYVDERLYFSYANEGRGWTAWPYNRPFYLILNLAVGGAWGAAKGIDDTAFPQRMEVDFVRVYQRQAD